MLSTRQERWDATLQVIAQDHVTPIEALVHIYYWSRFEFAAYRVHRNVSLANKYATKINANLDVFNLRYEMINL